MAKLNWQKVQQQSKQQSFNEKAPGKSYFSFDDNNLWSLTGKYYGTHLSKLPNKYLFWILENSKSGKHQGIAEGEIYRRYRNLSNT